MQLSALIQGVVSQQLLPRIDGHGRVLAVEVLVPTPAVAALIREGKTHQIYSTSRPGAKYGMQTLDSSLRSLSEQGDHLAGGAPPCHGSGGVQADCLGVGVVRLTRFPTSEHKL